MEIVQCKSEYKGKELIVHYTSEYYYDVSVDDFKVSFKRTPFGMEVHKRFTDTLLSDWLENPELYAIKEKEEVLGLVEISVESWNNRLRISNIWVHEKARNQGIGSELMEFVHKRAGELRVRAIILETQSCNDKAISFYLKHGFRLMGFDLTSYSNEDVLRKEVRIEMGKPL